MSQKSKVSVRLLVPRASAAGSQNRGDVVEVSAAEAKRLCEAVPPTAELVRGSGPETATAKRSSEKAVPRKRTAARKPAAKKA